MSGLSPNTRQSTISREPAEAPSEYQGDTVDRANLTGAPPMKGFADELVDEALGSSSKKWALVLVALIAGAVIAVWLQMRLNGADRDATQAAASDAAPSHVDHAQALRTSLHASAEQVRGGLNRWARLPKTGWQTARKAAGQLRH